MLGNNKPLKIGIIGCGRMGGGIAEKVSARQLCDHREEKAKKLGAEIGAKPVGTVMELAALAEVIILAVKPQNLGNIGIALRDKLSHHQILVSILAGTTMATLKHFFGPVSIVRMMPNLALLYGQGVIGVAEHDQMGHEIRKKVIDMFSCWGICIGCPKINWMPYPR